jgi:hypothetical protein
MTASKAQDIVTTRAAAVIAQFECLHQHKELIRLEPQQKEQ